MKPIRRLVILVMTLIFLFGLAMMLYPFVRGYLVDFRIGHAAQSFLSWVEVKPFIPDSSKKVFSFFEKTNLGWEYVSVKPFTILKNVSVLFKKI